MLDWIKNNGENVGIPLLILAVVSLIVEVILTLIGFDVFWMLNVVLASASVGLGFIAVGMAWKSDKRHNELLMKIDKKIADLPLSFNDEVLTESGQRLVVKRVKEIASEQSKEAAQKRLDEDTKRVGYVRGEIYHVKNGIWAIAWGGKYPL